MSRKAVLLTRIKKLTPYISEGYDIGGWVVVILA